MFRSPRQEQNSRALEMASIILFASFVFKSSSVLESYVESESIETRTGIDVGIYAVAFGNLRIESGVLGEGAYVLYRTCNSDLQIVLQVEGVSEVDVVNLYE